MQKSDSFLSFCFGTVAAYVPSGDLLSSNDVREMSLFVLKGIVSGLISLGVTWVAHRFFKKKPDA